MRSIFLSVVCAVLAAGVQPCGAVIIQGELYDSFALVNHDGVTPLVGDASSGDLVQIILAGADNTINAPNGTGGVSGDDVVFFTTHIGLGMVSAGTGMLDLYPLNYSSTLAGNSNIYVRFWNGTDVASSTYYGNSSVFLLPLGDAFNQSQLDFVPLSGSPHTTDQPFSLSVVPEPSSLFIFGLFVFGGWTWRRRRYLGVATIAVGMLLAAPNAPAQLALPLDVTASTPILDADGTILPGNNPAAADHGFTAIPGALVQIIAGSNGVAHLPNLDGSPGGGDAVMYTTVVGQGIDLDVQSCGRFSTSFSPPPISGAKLYARVFNAPTVGEATAWGQSATFSTTDAAVMDLSLLGVKATAMPKGVDLDSLDAKGVTYYQELVANTNPFDSRDVFDVTSVVPASGQGPRHMTVHSHVGRSYALQRSTDAFGASMTWADVTATGLLSADQNLILNDSNPPSSPTIFYRIKVTMP